MSDGLVTTVAAQTVNALVIITPIFPAGDAIPLPYVTDWDLSTPRGALVIEFNNQGVFNWPVLDAVLSVRGTIQNDMVWSSSRPTRAIARSPKVVRMQWSEREPFSGALITRSAYGLIELEEAGHQVGRQLNRKLRFFQGDIIYAYNVPEPFWSVP